MPSTSREAEVAAAPERSVLERLRTALPRGDSLPDAEWRRRHRFLLVVLWAHVAGLPVFGLVQGVPVWRCLMWGGVLAVPAILCTIGRNRRERWVSATMSVGLLTCSAVLISFWHGQTEAHFHFFVMIVLLTLYEEWLPFLIAAAFVAVHHGVLGTIDPSAVYDSARKDAHPWKWAAIHAGFAAAAGAAAVVAWRLNEDVRDERLRALERAVAAERALAASRDELARYAAELERSNADLEQFAYAASHDLSEPLTTVTGFLELLQQRHGAQLDDDAGAFVGYALDGSSRMKRLIDALMRYARLGRRPPLHEPVDLDAAAREALESLRARVDATSAVVEVGPLPVVLGDADQLVQVLQNVLSNALKFARDGEPPRITVSARAEGGMWRIAVADRGIGIGPASREQVFTMFHRLNGADRYDGTGIGLAIAARVVERHGGRIWVEETPGGGATFVFTLPAAPDAAPRRPDEPEPRRAAPA